MLLIVVSPRRKGADRLDGEAQPFAAGGQESPVPFLPAAEGVVMADEDLADSELFPEDVANEPIRRGLCIFKGKGDQDKGIDPEALDEPDLLRKGGDQVEGAPFRMENHLGVGVEADDDGRAFLPVRLLDQLSEDELVAEVNPVKVADGHHCSPQTGGYIFTAL